jgi:hypothetical protein
VTTVYSGPVALPLSQLVLGGTAALVAMIVIVICVPKHADICTTSYSNRINIIHVK